MIYSKQIKKNYNCYKSLPPEYFLIFYFASNVLKQLRDKMQNISVTNLNKVTIYI